MPRKSKQAKLSRSSCAVTPCDVTKIITIDQTQMPFNKKSRKRQQHIFRSMKNVLDTLFDDNFMDQSADCIEFLDYCRSTIVDTIPCEQVQAEEAMTEQMSSLSLAERNTLIRLLTHRGGEINENMIGVFPSLRKRSEHLLLATKRKEREDKIPLALISKYMHDRCR